MLQRCYNSCCKQNYRIQLSVDYTNDNSFNTSGFNSKQTNLQQSNRPIYFMFWSEMLRNGFIESNTYYSCQMHWSWGAWWYINDSRILILTVSNLPRSAIYVSSVQFSYLNIEERAPAANQTHPDRVPEFTLLINDGYKCWNVLGVMSG